MILQSYQLLEREKEHPSGFTDFSFILFPVSKAYEGFLKRYLLENDLIAPEAYKSRKFRIGKAINPDISPSHRDEHWVYDDIVRVCGEGLARDMWQAWLECRNRVFHYFYDEDNVFSLTDIEEMIAQVLQVMATAVACQLGDDLDGVADITAGQTDP